MIIITQIRLVLFLVQLLVLMWKLSITKVWNFKYGI